LEDKLDLLGACELVDADFDDLLELFAFAFDGDKDRAKRVTFSLSVSSVLIRSGSALLLRPIFDFEDFVVAASVLLLWRIF